MPPSFGIHLICNTNSARCATAAYELLVLSRTLYVGGLVMFMYGCQLEDDSPTPRCTIYTLVMRGTTVCSEDRIVVEKSSVDVLQKSIGRVLPGTIPLNLTPTPSPPQPQPWG